jgi:hypothetical protein
METSKYIIKLEMEKNYYKNSRPALRLSSSIKLLFKDAWKCKQEHLGEDQMGACTIRV